MSKPRRALSRTAPDGDALAWALASAANPHLTQRESDRIYIAIGIGETFEAIDDLITVIARERIPVSDDLVAAVIAWLDCYVGQDAEPRLREVIAEVTISPPQQMPQADTLRRYLHLAAKHRHRRSAG